MKFYSFICCVWEILDFLYICKIIFKSEFLSIWKPKLMSYKLALRVQFMSLSQKKKAYYNEVILQVDTYLL